MNRLHVLALTALIPLVGCQKDQTSAISAETKKDGHDVCLDGNDIDTVEKFHKSIKKQAEFPDYYGENLDALWDVLTGTVEPVRVTWYNYEKSEEALNQEDGAFLRIRKVFADARRIGSRSELKLVEAYNSPEKPCEEKPAETRDPSIPVIWEPAPGEIPETPTVTDPSIPVFQ